ncbi:hypothetical protein [Hyphomicrobium sp. D-2]|uniref:hypothetical protein n=1 Tax=Hyphomicrobium sp. D-2 TaxID=3041621 RepID=UPI0024552BA6|nr:hypothetical protein [Hyphomicrobium sp. D-2]MDH4981467.1 hypothetical protein [Hyphomicrobium sp. D-2]
MTDQNTQSSDVAAEAPGASINPVDDFAALLNEYDRSVESSTAGAAASAPMPTQSTESAADASQVTGKASGGAADPVQQQFRDMIERGEFDERNARISQLEGFAHEAAAFMQTQHQAQVEAALRARDKADAEAVFSEAETIMADFPHVNMDVRAWLKNELDLNAELARAWEGRHESNEAMRHARSAVDRALKKLHLAAKREGERIAGLQDTEDRAVVTASVVRGGESGPPLDKPVRVGKLSDDDLKKHMRDKHGYTPHF